MNAVSTPSCSDLPVLRVPRFDLPERIDTGWNPTFPEFAAAANAVSLLMPHVEPYVARSVRAGGERIGGRVGDEARAFAAQELQHQAQHRRVNDVVLEGTPSLRRVDRWAASTYRWLGRRRSLRWSLAFAAGFETSAFALARWTERHLRLLFDDADESIATLLIWHLAEEVEHKAVAADVHRAVDGSRLRYLAASCCSLALLAWFTVLGTITQLVASGRAWSPFAWWRLLRWSISLAFEVLPDLFVSALPGHHPSQLADPTLLVGWLRSFDPDDGRDPLRRR